MRAFPVTPHIALMVTAVIVFAGELIVMLVLSPFEPLPLHAAPLADAALLTLFIFPALYFALFRPLTQRRLAPNSVAAAARLARKPPDGRIAPRMVFVKTGVTVFVGEVIVMLVLRSLPVAPAVEPVIDATLLTLLIFPALYFVLFRPLASATVQHGLMTGQLQETTERLAVAALDWRVTFDSVESPILVLDADARVHRLNRAAMELAGEPFSAILGRPVASLGSGELWPAVANLVREVRETRAPTTCHLKDESEGRTWDIAVSRVTYPTGEKDRVTVIARDITHMTELQESLRRTENMAAMGRLVAGVAHEVRNPLFGILATLDALEIGLEAPNDGSRYLEVLRHEAGRLTELMQDLMDYGRPVDLQITNCSVADVINGAVKECEPLAREADVQLVSAVTEQHVAVPLDLRCLSQAFHNLLVNAIHYSPPQGVVEVEAQDIRRGERLWVQCAVRDSGPGIASQDMPRIFQPFFTKRAQGNGLGLSIVQRIVEQHGGTIWAENRPEGGAALMLQLPGGPCKHGDT